jgi:uncharacterized membrane protein YeaQ/YmgE (transglycosylase-associated protein family)
MARNGVTYFLAWLLIGLGIGWAFKTLMPGFRNPRTVIILAVIGAIGGGFIAYAVGVQPPLGASPMAAGSGAIVFSIVFMFYEIGQKSP